MSEITAFPMAAVSILGATEQRFKARLGIDLESTPLEQAFCRYTVREPGVMVVPDAALDDRFSTNPLVTGSPHIRSYAGAPLTLSNGSTVGALCVLDVVPRDVGPREMELLGLMARTVVGQLEYEQLIEQQSRDIVDLRAHQQELHHRATHDHLTSVLNRRGLIGQLDARLAAERMSGAVPAHPLRLFFIDLDNFKMVNDSLGHEAGDRVLAATAGRLVAMCRPGDLVARIGGDEFIVVSGGDSAVSAEQHAERLLAGLNAPFALGGGSIMSSASIGISCDPGAPATAVDLIDAADRAMYAVKETGGARSSGHRERLQAASNADIRSRCAFVSEVLRHDRILAHYQPICDLASRETLGYEALVRWHGREPLGTTPASFIVAAESAGLVSDVGREMLRQASSTAASFDDDPYHRGQRIAVNLSPTQVRPGLAEEVAEILEQTGLAPQKLTIEITEAQSLPTGKVTQRVLESLTVLGVRLSLDDFGTGYASLAMLLDLPFDELKIDRMFCASEDASVLQIVSASASVARSFELHVVAEGIETETAAARMLDLGCNAGQGYLFGHPVPTPKGRTRETSGSSASSPKRSFRVGRG